MGGIGFTLLELGLALSLVALAWWTSRLLRRAHERSLTNTERRLAHVQLLTTSPVALAHCGLVAAEAVIAIDSYSALLLRWRQLLGGESLVVNTILQRGRREVLVRLQREAVALGGNAVIQLRLDCLSFQAGDRSGAKRFCILAYGTAVRR